MGTSIHPVAMSPLARDIVKLQGRLRRYYKHEHVVCRVGEYEIRQYDKVGSPDRGATRFMFGVRELMYLSAEHRDSEIIGRAAVLLRNDDFAGFNQYLHELVKGEADHP